MNCLEFEGIVVELAREGPGAGQLEGWEHAATCERCARRLANEQLLSAVATAAKQEDEARSAPPIVEKMLVVAFREQHAGRRMRRLAWFRRVITGGIAAGLILAAVVTWRRPNPQPAQVKSAPVPAAEPAKVIAPVYREPQRSPARVLRAARARTARPFQTADREVTTDFIPLVYDPEPVDQGRVVRVRLPRAALAAFGLPMNEQLADEPIEADVLLGEDGLARAVRFVE